jgi:glycerophosphoryl diester phosphodiesterase
LQLPAEGRARLMAYGGARPIARLAERVPGMRVMSRQTLVACATRYLTLGWSGHLPAACRDTIVLVPVNIFARLPDDFSGGIWTNRTDRIAPLVGR